MRGRPIRAPLLVRLRVPFSNQPIALGRLVARRVLEGAVILICNYEELNAVRAGGQALLEEGSFGGRVAAPSATRVAVESLLARPTGDISLSTLGEQIETERALRAIVEHLRAEMDQHVLASHPAAEPSVAAYFDFAHALAVLGRVREIGEEMHALVEVMTEGSLDQETIRSFVFPD